MRTIRTLSIIVGLALPGVMALTAPAAGEMVPPTTTTAKGGTGLATGYPTLVGVRWAAHPGYDRIVFDFTGGTPKWRVAYGTLYSEGLGTPISLAGGADLVIRFEHAKAHDAYGRPTYRMTTVLDPMLTSLRQVKFGGDFEGYVTAGLGLREKVGFRAFTLSNPGRFVVDVAHKAPTTTC